MAGLPPFQSLLDEHGALVHRFLVARVGPVDADDVYQETWLSALRAYPGLTDGSNLRSWVMTIAHHKVIDHARRRARRPVPAEAVEELAPATAGDRAPALDEGHVWAQVSELPEKQRAAVALRFIADFSHAEIGAAMDTSEAAARRNVHEALKRLRGQAA